MTTASGATTPGFSPFDSTSELWNDYYARFLTFIGAHAVKEERQAQVFLTNQTPTTYKLLDNLARQQTPPKEVNSLTLEEIVVFMTNQFDPKRFIVRERYKFWSDMQRKPGESIQELAARIRYDAATCDFPSIKDPQDEALRQRFICSVNNEAVVKTLFQIKDNELTFTKAIETAIQVEESAKVAKQQVQGFSSSVRKVKSKSEKQKQETSPNDSKIVCYRCGHGHKATDCAYKEFVCNFCNLKGHLEKVCRKKTSQPKSSQKKSNSFAKKIDVCNIQSYSSVPKLEKTFVINEKDIILELDTATSGNFIGYKNWVKVGKPQLTKSEIQFESATQHKLKIKGKFTAKVSLKAVQEQHDDEFHVVETPDLNLLGRGAIIQLDISLDEILLQKNDCNKVFDDIVEDKKLSKECQKLCDEFPNLWKPELGCLQGVEIEVQFKENAPKIFKKARPVPYAMESDLEDAYLKGIERGIWEPTKFNEFGTPVVPIKKALLPGQLKPKLRVCGDYSVTVNEHLMDHRHPLPRPEDLMRKLGGGYGFTKIDLADAYNQIKLGPDSQKRLALNTHKGVLLQKRLPFGIKSAPGYFLQIMDQLTSDLSGVAVYLDDILVSGKDSDDHLKNLRKLLQRLDEKGLRCRLEKCQFAKPHVDYLGHQISKDGIAKGKKVDDVLSMPAPNDVSSLKSFLGSVQFYAKFLPSNFATITSPLYKLLKKGVAWKWSKVEQTSFEELKKLLSSDNVLVHFDPKIPIGIACDASNTGIGAVLFHRYSDGSERPICNVSKILSKSQQNYSQIQKEALSIIFGIKKFHQYIYGRKFILVTDHRPLLAMFGPGKETPSLAANRLCRWALTLSQFDYKIEYRKSSQHGNADSLSRLPARDDVQFDAHEKVDDLHVVCSINHINNKLETVHSGTLQQETLNDPLLSTLRKFMKEGWPKKKFHAGSELRVFRQHAEQLSIVEGCLMMGERAVIPRSLRQNILNLLHMGHFGMERMKKLARTVVYWPNIDVDITDMCRHCITCAEFQNKPTKTFHPWCIPDEPWSRVHVDHAVNFMGINWLILTDAFSKYPCIHATNSLSTTATIQLLEESFAHFGYPKTLVSDNGKSFLSEQFQKYCSERGILHLTGPPYHPESNGAAERLIQTFKKGMRKSVHENKNDALREFLIQYRRTPTQNGKSPSQMLNGREIRTKIDVVSPKGNNKEKITLFNDSKYRIGDPVWVLNYQDGPRWISGVVLDKIGTTIFKVRLHKNDVIVRRHDVQMKWRYTEDDRATPNNEDTDIVPFTALFGTREEQRRGAETNISGESEPPVSGSSAPPPPARDVRRGTRYRTLPQFYGRRC